VLALLWAAPVSAQPPGKIIQHDFRGRKPLGADWKIVPPDHEDFVKFEDEGLRVTIPKTRLSNQPIGVRLSFPATGDFEITTAYELLSADKPPPKGNGVGIGFNLIVRNDYQKFAKLGHFLLASGENSFVAERTFKGETNNQWKSVPTTAMAGRLKVIRTGSELRYLVAEAPANEFREILRADFTPEDLEIVRLGVNNNASPAGVDARIADISIRFGAAVPGANPAAADGQASPQRGGNMLILILTGVGLLLIMAIAIIVTAWRKRRADKPDETGLAAAMIAFFCSHCGTKLKVKPESAAKKIQCPKCGGTTAVP
jgi:hypothetical protein